MPLGKLNPIKDDDKYKGVIKRCNSCNGCHPEEAVRKTGSENEYGVWFLCACGTTVLWTKEEQSDPESV